MPAADDDVKGQVNISYHLADDPHCGLTVKATEAELDRDFARLKAIGFTHVTLWPGVAIARGNRAERMTKLAVRKAAEHGLRCYIWFWTTGKPLMYKHPFWRKNSPPFVDKDGGKIEYINLWDEKWRGGFLKDYLHYLGRTFSKFPNVEGYVVDEPDGCGWKWNQYGYDEQTRRQFVAWLKKKYGTLAAVKSAWDAKYRSWDQVAGPSVEPSAGEIRNTRSPVGRCWRDWTAARAEFFVDWFADVNRYLKESHPGSRILWSVTARYVDESRADALADCLDWRRIAPHIDTMLMAKFQRTDAEAVKFSRDVLDGLVAKPEMKRVPKIFAVIIWRCSWVEKLRPATLRKMLQLASNKGFGIYVWSWQGNDHLEAWPDLQKVFKQSYRGA